LLMGSPSVEYSADMLTRHVIKQTGMDDSILGHYTEFGGFSLDNFEFHCPHAATNKECVALADRSICFEELGLEVDIEDVTTETFDGVVERQDVYPLAVLYVITLMDVDKIAKFHAQVIPATLFT
ncbi:hypothetical protein EDD22DRAFT_878536, partial [Suillus occidentalis]